MNATAANAETGNWHIRQRQTLTTYTPSNPALPSEYNCPKGACATPPPPAPVIPTPSIKEGFNHQIRRTSYTWILTMAAATTLFITLTCLVKRN